MEIRNYWVDIEDSSGARIGAGPLRASVFRFSPVLSASGEFSFEVSAADPNIAVLSEKRTAICRYIDRNGDTQVFGGGVIDKIVLSFAEDGSLVYQVSGNDLTRELGYRSVGALDLSGMGGAGVANAPTQIMALAPSGWTISDGTTDTNVYAGFDGESVLNALLRAGEYIGEHWRLGAGRNIEWLGVKADFAASGLRAVQHVNDSVAVETADGIALITSLEEEQDSAELLSRVIPRGAGNGGVVATLAHATESAPAGFSLDTANNYVKKDATETSYGRIERVIDFKDIGPISNTTADIQAAANALLQASVEHLNRYSAPAKFYRLGLAKVNTLLSPGTTLRVVYRKRVDGRVIHDIDADLVVLQVTREITAEGAGTVGALVSTIERLPQSDSAFLAQQAVNGRVLAAHQQLGASVDTFTFRDEMDDSKGAGFRFWLGAEYTSIQQVILRFKINPLRSTVKSVAGASTTTASGGGSTSGSGGSSTPTSAGGSHGHDISYQNGTSGNPVYKSGGFLYTTGGGTTQTLGDSPAHTHAVTIPAHTHSTPDHTHDLTPNISTVYGIFEESGGSTLAESDLVYKLNGGSDLGAGVVDIGSGWYALDITDELVDSAFRPGQENNVLEITTATAKTARIEAQLTIRGVVQAVAYT